MEQNKDLTQYEGFFELRNVNDPKYVNDFIDQYKYITVSGPITLIFEVSREYTDFIEAYRINKKQITFRDVINAVVDFYMTPLTKNQLLNYLKEDGDTFGYIKDAITNIDKGYKVHHYEIMGDKGIEFFDRDDDNRYPQKRKTTVYVASYGS